MLQAHTSERSAERPAGSTGPVAAGIGRRLSGIGRTMLSLLLPPLCLGCETVLGAEERWLCAGCSLRISQSARPRTRTIGLGVPVNETCGSADQNGASPPFIAELRIDYALDYISTVSKLITELKYGDKPGLAGVLAPFMDSALTGPVPGDTAVVPVPVHPSRRRERGYNQSELLAARIARLRGLSLKSGILLKTRNTGSQTGLEREEREQNVVGSFGLCRSDRLSGMRILLVDDVVTTGSTLRECAIALLESGAMEVSACVAASSP